MMSSDKNIDSNLKEIAEIKLREQRNLIDYNTVSYPLEYFCEKISQQEIEDSLRWNEKQQSYFIESLLLGLPVLNIIIKIDSNDTDTNTEIEIIDGRQRMYAAINFLSNKLTLSHLNKLIALNGFKFKDLLPPRQKSFRRSSVRTIIVGKNSNNSVWEKSARI